MSYYVVTRTGKKESVHFDEITKRIQGLCDEEPRLPSKNVDPILITKKVIQGLYPGVTTAELDE